jgi:hypothetical protein
VDERLIIFGWAAGGGLLLGGVGALFGGLAGYVARFYGRRPGGFVGWRAIRAVERVLGRELSPLQAGVLIGAVDGASFLGVFGVLLGLLAGELEWFPSHVLAATYLGFILLATLAAGLGMAAYAFAHGGMIGFSTACAGGLAGIYVGALTAGTTGIIVGAWIGLLLGFLAGWLGRRGRSRTTRIREESGLHFYSQENGPLSPPDFEEPEP